jgi:hypothetical protein
MEKGFPGGESIAIGESARPRCRPRANPPRLAQGPDTVRVQVDASICQPGDECGQPHVKPPADLRVHAYPRVHAARPARSNYLGSADKDSQGTKTPGSTRTAARAQPSPTASPTSSPACRLWRVTRSPNVRAFSDDPAGNMVSGPNMTALR